MCRQMLLPWQMLLPYTIVADFIATEEDVKSSFIASCQMLLPYDIVVDVKTTRDACFNSYLAGVICQVADGIATFGWMCVGRCYYQVADGTAKGLLNLV